MSFVILSIAMILACLAFIVIPLVKRMRQRSPDAQTLTDALYATRVQELDEDVESGTLARADYASARDDLEREFSESGSQSTPATAGVHRRWGKWTAIAVAFLVPIIAVVLYVNMGSWRSGVYGTQSQAAIIHNVSSRVQADPTDPKGWAYLGELYFKIKQYKNAVNAYKHAVALTHRKVPSLLSALGVAEMWANDMQVTPTISTLFDDALALDPNDSGALLFGAMAAFQKGDKATAIQRWTVFVKHQPPSRLRRAVAKRIVAAGGTLPTLQKSAHADTSGPVIHVKVRLSPQVSAKLDTPITLFVLARPAKTTHGAPLAVRRIRVSRAKFPVTVTLSDANAMVGGHHLADYAAWRIVARLSRSGQARKQVGDVTGHIVLKHEGDEAKGEIILNHVVGATAQ